MSYAIRRRIPPGAVIDTDDEREVSNWASWLGVSEPEVLAAVERVGPFAAAVRDYLCEEE